MHYDLPESGVGWSRLHPMRDARLWLGHEAVRACINFRRLLSCSLKPFRAAGLTSFSLISSKLFTTFWAVIKSRVVVDCQPVPVPVPQIALSNWLTALVVKDTVHSRASMLSALHSTPATDIHTQSWKLLIMEVLWSAITHHVPSCWEPQAQ